MGLNCLCFFDSSANVQPITPLTIAHGKAQMEGVRAALEHPRIIRTSLLTYCKTRPAKSFVVYLALVLVEYSLYRI